MQSLLWRASRMLAALGCLAALLTAPSGVQAQWICEDNGCTIPAGTYTSPQQQEMNSVGNSFASATNYGTLNVSLPRPNNAYNVVLTFEYAGADGSQPTNSAPSAGTSSGD